MNINYILSETTNSATSVALRDITKKAEENPFSNYIVLVPEPKSIAIERELLDLSKNGAFANIFVYSFVRLLSRIGEINEQDVVSKQTCVMLLRKIIFDNFDKLYCYQKTAKTVGFAEKIYNTIEQLKTSGLTAQDVKVLSESASGSLSSKMKDIYVLFNAFETALGTQTYDDCDRLRILGELAKSNEFVKQAEIFVVGFDNVTADMVEVLKEFALNSKAITFSCVYFNENRKDKYIQDNELYHKFIGIAQRLNYPYVPKFVSAKSSGDFWNIQNYVFSTEKKKVERAGNLKVYEFENKNNEIEALAQQILQEVKDGKRYRDIAVIDGELDSDLDLICKTFDDYDISYFVSKSYDISSHYFVKFIKNSIDVIGSRFSMEKVLKWLANPMINIDCFSEFENYVKEFGINYSLFFNKVTEKQVEDEVVRNKLNAVIDFICLFNDKFGKIFSSENSIEIFVEEIKNLAEFVNAEKIVTETVVFEQENNLLIDAEISKIILEKFKKINENISKFLGDKIVQPNEFLQVYLSGFAEEEVNLVPISIDCVLIQKNADGLYKIKDLFVVGAVDGVFPTKMQDTGILLDSELENSNEILCKKIEPTIKNINKRENFSIYEILLIASEKLIVSYSLRSFGCANKPSNVVNRLLKLFDMEEHPDKYVFQRDFISKKSSEKQFAKHIGIQLSESINDNASLNVEYNKLRNILTPNFKDYIDNICFGEKEFKIAKAKEIYFLNNKTSVSQLEKYFACPYSFFAKYGLRLKENKDASLSSLDIGTIVHKFAELFINNIKEFDNKNDEEFNKKSKEILSKSLVELEINENKNIAIINFIYDEIVRLAKYLYFEQSQSSFKNDAKLNEFEFKGNNAVRLKIDDSTVISIEGKIDRIDKFGDYIRIIDYKTGETDSNLGAIYFGKKIQLVSYLSACENIDGKKVAGLFYFPIHSDFVKIDKKMKNNYKMQGFILDDIDVTKYMDSNLSFEHSESDLVPLKIKTNKDVIKTGEFAISGLKNVAISSESFDNIKDYTEKLCIQAVNEILDGNIEPSPISKLTDKESVECQYCDYAGFCGKEHARFGSGRRCGGKVDEANFNLKQGDENDEVDR